jgi:hypothetical protein
MAAPGQLAVMAAAVVEHASRQWRRRRRQRQQQPTDGVRAKEEECLGVEGLSLDRINSKAQHLQRVRHTGVRRSVQRQGEDHRAVLQLFLAVRWHSMHCI